MQSLLAQTANPEAPNEVNVSQPSDALEELGRRDPGKATHYRGVADWWGRHVWVERDGIRGSLSHRGEDPRVSYAWGRSGIGARELARALLFDATDNAALSERYCRDFTHEVVAHLPEPEFVLGRDDILAWIADRPGQRTA